MLGSIDICKYIYWDGDLSVFKFMSIISIAASIMKRKSIGAMLSPCFTITIDSNLIIAQPFLNQTLLFLYNLLMLLIMWSLMPCFISEYVK